MFINCTEVQGIIFRFYGTYSHFCALIFTLTKKILRGISWSVFYECLCLLRSWVHWLWQLPVGSLFLLNSKQDNSRSQKLNMVHIFFQMNEPRKIIFQIHVGTKKRHAFVAFIIDPINFFIHKLFKWIIMYRFACIQQICYILFTWYFTFQITLDICTPPWLSEIWCFREGANFLSLHGMTFSCTNFEINFNDQVLWVFLAKWCTFHITVFHNGGVFTVIFPRLFCVGKTMFPGST